MSTLAQNAAAIVSNYGDIKTAIQNKGITVTANTPVTQYPALIGAIDGGGGDYETISLTASSFGMNTQNFSNTDTASTIDERVNDIVERIAYFMQTIDSSFQVTDQSADGKARFKVCRAGSNVSYIFYNYTRSGQSYPDCGAALCVGNDSRYVSCISILRKSSSGTVTSMYANIRYAAAANGGFVIMSGSSSSSTFYIIRTKYTDENSVTGTLYGVGQEYSSSSTKYIYWADEEGNISNTNSATALTYDTRDLLDVYDPIAKNALFKLYFTVGNTKYTLDNMYWSTAFDAMPNTTSRYGTYQYTGGGKSFIEVIGFTKNGDKASLLIRS